jgi:hypothetical protein
MKNTLRLLLFVVSLVLTAFASKANAFVSPLSFNLFPPVEFPSSEYSVAGLRLSALWGDQRDLYGIDLGLLGNITEQRFVGAAFSGLFNVTHGDTTVVGFQIAGLANVNTNKTNVVGLQAALGINYHVAESSIEGLELAFIGNYAPHTNIYGAQIGLYNKAQDVYGIQFGLVNSCSDLHGLQIGLVNFNDKGLFAVSPILNVGF